MSSMITYITIPVSQRLAEELPSDPATRTQVLELGLRQWRVRQALEAYRRGQGSLDAIKLHPDIWIAPALCDQVIDALRRAS